MYKEFAKYVDSYNKEDGIILKELHSKRVALISKNIAKKLKWSKKDIKLAEQIGLLHDIGRFDEWKLTGNYSNNDFDHANHGVKVLKNNNLIDKFNNNDEEKEIIYEAIYHHNKYNLPSKCNKFSKLVRDADKIDILFLRSINNIKYNDNQNSISLKVQQDFSKEKIILYSDVNTKGDYLILLLAFVFDLNYDYSLKILKDNNYINKIYQKLDNKEIYQVYFNKVNDYIEKRIQNVR